MECLLNKLEGKPCIAGRRGRFDDSPVIPHDLTGKAQPDARSILLGREERYKNLIHYFGRNTRSIIYNPHLQVACLRATLRYE